jgi:hypothetical protein
VSQAHSFQWLGSFGNRGNGRYREELRQATGAIDSYLAAKHFPREHALLRLDGQYGTGAVLADVPGFSFVTRGKDYTVLKQPEIQARLHLPADQSFSRPESALVRQLYDCPDVAVGPAGVRCRVVVATHPKGTTKRRIGCVCKGVVYELFVTNLPRDAFPAADVLALYLHRGAFEPTLADEDGELDPDRWCSHSAWGQEAWQCVAQWVWNLRLELGHHLKPEQVRTTEFAPAFNASNAEQALVSGYEPPIIGRTWKTGRYAGEDFTLQADGTVCCPAGKNLFLQEHRQERDGSLRMVYEARIADCRACEQRPQCQWHGHQAQHPRRVSVLLHPRRGGSAPLLWRDWPRRRQRRACIQVLHHQHLGVEEAAAPPTQSPEPPTILSRAQRAHSRLSWHERLARNARADTAGQLTLKLFAIPERFATWLGLTVA